jgi:hypothetical protein
MTRDYRTLDAIVVLAFLAMLFCGGYVLAFVRIPEQNLPIFASLLSSSAIGGIATYIAWRWSNGPKKPEPPGTTITTPAGPSTLTLEQPGQEKPPGTDQPNA